MAQREIETVFGAKEEVLSSTLSSLKELDIALSRVGESFSSAVKQSEELDAAVGAVEKTEKGMATEEKIAELALTYEKLGATKEELLAIDVREFEKQGATIEQAERYKKVLEDTQKIKEGVGPAFAEFYRQNLTEAALQNKMYEESLQSLGAVQSSVYQGMEDQLMSYVETGRFSVGALMQVVAKQVKTELVGLAAKSAVWAIYETAMGLAMLWINPSASATHFKAAGQFALVGGAAMAAASGVNSLLGGKSKDSSSGAGFARGGSLSAYPAPEREEPKQTQNITLQIYNPLSQQNWAEIAEKNILPALKDASDRNIVMNVKTAYA